MRYTITPTYAMSLRNDHNTAALKIGRLDIGEQAKGDELWTASITTSSANAGDKWMRVREINGLPADGWIAIIHRGVVYCTLTDSGGVPTDPPTAEDVIASVENVEIHLTDTTGAKWVVYCTPISAQKLQ